MPQGTILLIAVGDEAGLNHWDVCAPLPYPWTSALKQRLASLGSTEIQDYCCRDQWAMIAVKGQGKLSEALGHDSAHAPTEATFQLP